MLKMLLKKCMVAVIMMVYCGPLFSGQSIAPFKPGERIVFLGDSITQMGMYIGYMQLFYGLRHPGSKNEFVNGGILGECAADGIVRLNYDVMIKNPDRIFIMFGMNDVGRDNYRNNPPDDNDLKKRQESLARYENQLTALVDKIAASGKPSVLITSTPYDQYNKLKCENLPGCNEPGLRQCAEIVKRLASEKRLDCIDLHSPMTELLIKSPGTLICGTDRIHPGSAGHMLMAALILKACGETPEVAACSIDVKEKDCVCRNAAVDDLQITPEKVSFTYSPGALPFPRSVARGIANIYPFTANLNVEELRIAGLARGEYELKAGGKVIGSFTADQLRQGINLALLDTPSQQISEAAAKIAGQLVDAESQLRYLQLGEKIIRKEGGNPDNLQEGFAVLDNYLQKQQKSPWYNFTEKTVNFYKTNKPRQARLMESVGKYRQQLRAVRPLSFHIEITQSAR